MTGWGMRNDGKAGCANPSTVPGIRDAALAELFVMARHEESFEKCHFEERERREILKTAVCSRFLPSVEMTKMAVIQSSQCAFEYRTP